MQLCRAPVKSTHPRTASLRFVSHGRRPVVDSNDMGRGMAGYRWMVGGGQPQPMWTVAPSAACHRGVMSWLVSLSVSLAPGTIDLPSLSPIRNRQSLLEPLSSSTHTLLSHTHARAHALSRFSSSLAHTHTPASSFSLPSSLLSPLPFVSRLSRQLGHISGQG